MKNIQDLLCVLSIILLPVNKVIFMRFEVLSYILIKCAIGLCMLAQSIYHLVVYDSYISTLEMYLKSMEVLDTNILYLAVPLFPFIEFALGLMLILEVYYKETTVVTVLLSCSISVIYFYTDYPIGYSLMLLLISLLSIWHFVKKVYKNKYKNLSYL